MKKATLVILALAMLVPMAAMAQTTSSGTLAVTATVQSSIYLTLENAPGGIALTNPSTPAATMPLGTVSAYGGTVPTNVAKATVGTPITSFTLTTAFGVKVVQVNTGFASYALTAALQTADAVNTWTVDGKVLTTTAQAITAGTAFAAIGSHSFVLTIPSTLAAGSISNTINLVATAS
jgi:hypothetical protein